MRPLWDRSFWVRKRRFWLTTELQQASRDGLGCQEPIWKLLARRVVGISPGLKKAKSLKRFRKLRAEN